MNINRTKNAFLESISELCKTLSPAKLQELDGLLSQKRSEIEIISDIVISFPTFKQLYKARLSQ